VSKRLTPSSTSLQSSRLSNCWHLAAPSFPRPLPPGQPEQRAISSLFYPFSPRSRYHSHLKISILFTPSSPRNRYLIKRIIHFPYTLANIPQLTSLLLNPGKPIRMEGLAPFQARALAWALARAGSLHPSAYPHLPMNLNQLCQKRLLDFWA
jgi:hypothetical protein